MIPNQQQIPPQKLHDDSNKTCKVTKHFIINKSKEPNCQRRNVSTGEIATLPACWPCCINVPEDSRICYHRLQFAAFCWQHQIYGNPMFPDLLLHAQLQDLIAQLYSQIHLISLNSHGSPQQADH